MTAAELLAQAAQALAAAGIADPRREARLLLAHASGLDQAALLRDLHAPMAAPGLATLLLRRAAREPLALITGRQGFWTLDLEVSADTLIPRADSEAVVEAALAACPSPTRVLDLGTGTGCLLLAVLAERPQATGVGIDRAEGAVRLARRNAEATGMAARTAFICGDWASSLDARFDLVLSNPPYIETAAIAHLMPEVARFEPHDALDGGADGLVAYRAILPALSALLEPHGAAVLEMGIGQAPAIARLAALHGLIVDGYRHDLGAIQRAIVLRRVQAVGEPGMTRPMSPPESPAMTDTPPDRLSNNAASPHYDAVALQRGIGIRFNGVEKTTVEEYCVSEGWVRIAVGKTLDRRGNPLTMKLNGIVEPYFRDAQPVG